MTTNPVSTEELNEVKASTRNLNDFVADVIEDGDAAIGTRSSWLEKVEAFYSKQYGVKKEKTFPWPGASNINIPLIDKTIRRKKPGYVNLVFASSPVCTFNPVGAEDISKARLAETYFDWRWRTSMTNTFKETVRGVDEMLSRGFFVWKTGWEFESRWTSEDINFAKEIPANDAQNLQAKPDVAEDYFAQKYGFSLDDEDDAKHVRAIVAAWESGEDGIAIEREEVVKNKPFARMRGVADIIVPEDTTDIEDSRFVVDRMFLTKNDLLKKQKDGIYKDVDMCTPVRSKAANEESGKLRQKEMDRVGIVDGGTTGSSTNSEDERPSALYEIWECYTWYDINGDGIDERVILTVDHESSTVLQFVELPFDHGQWPFVQARLEETSPWFYASRGLPQMLDDMSTEINAQHNGKIDQMTIANSPMLKIRGTVTAANLRFIPGQGVRVTNQDDIRALEIPNKDISFEREEMILKAWADEYIGDPSSSLNNTLSSTVDAPTATQVKAVQYDSSMVFSLDGAIFQDAMKKVYEQIWSMECQFGDDDIWIRVTGQEPIKMSRHEIAGSFDLQPTGTTATINPTVEAQKAQNRLALLAQDPYIRQRELRADYLEKDDGRLVDRLLKTEEEMQQEAQAAQAAAQAPATVDELQGALGQLRKQGKGAVSV